MMKFFISLIVTLFSFSPVVLKAKSPDFPLGPIGGRFQITTGKAYVRVTAITPGGPGATAGLQVGDYITGTDGMSFAPTGDNFKGATRELGWAIEQAEATDGILALDVLRSGVGQITVNVQIPAVGFLSPAFPLNSPKWVNTYEDACKELHTRLMQNNGWVGYLTGWAGLTLLASPHWNETTGDTPFRLSIDKVYQQYKKIVEDAQYAPVERYLFDGSLNPNFNGSTATYLENWDVGLGMMFLSEYYAKTQQPDDLTLLQTGAEKLGNRIQWWCQPSEHVSRGAELRIGQIGHNNVVDDYMWNSYAGGINIVGIHVTGGLALAKAAGVDMTVSPVDGRYFGYDPRYFNGDDDDGFPASALPAGMTPKDVNGNVVPLLPDKLANGNAMDFTKEQPNLNDKLDFAWSFYKASQYANGTITYAPGAGSYADSGGRTAGVLFTTSVMKENGWNFQGDDLTAYNRLITYHNKEYDIHLNAHTFNIAGPTFMAMSLPMLEQKNRRHFLHNLSFFYNLMRKPDGSLQFMRGRYFGGDNEGGSVHDVVNIYFALLYGVANGGLELIDGFDTANQRLVSFSKMPHMQWKDIETRTLDMNAPGDLTFDLVVTDGAGVPTTDYTAAWTVVSSSASQPTFSDASALNTTITFTQAGVYDLLLTVTSVNDPSIVTEEPIRITVPLAVDESNYLAGKARYRIYKNIQGNYVSNLTDNPKYPDSPDEERFLTKLDGDEGGSSFGATITAVITPSETGDYRFYIASDNRSELYFNSNGVDPAGAVKIASVDGSKTGREEWNKYASQESAVIHLTAGQKYYLQVLHKEGGGAEHVEVGWKKPSSSNIEIIGSQYIAAPYIPTPVAITTQPTDVVCALGDNVTLSATTSGDGLSMYQWRLNGVPFGPPLDEPSITLSNVSAYMDGTWDLVYTNGSTVVTSDPITVTVSDIGDYVNGSLWHESYFNIGGSLVSDLTSNSKYPLTPDSSGFHTSTILSKLDNNYGERLTGWIVPEETADYKFYVSGDDRVSLYLSTDASRDNKQLLVETTYYSGHMQWSSDRASSWIHLEAGKRYYVEFIHKESSGGGDAALTWQKQGDPDPVNGVGGIPSYLLQSVKGGNAIDVPSDNAISINCTTKREVVEGLNSSITYQLTRGGDLSQPVTVHLTTSGTATANVDYVAPATVTIPAGSASVDFTVDIVNDFDVEDPETLVVSVLPDPQYELGYSLAPSVTMISHNIEMVSQSVDTTSVVGHNVSFFVQVTGSDQAIALGSYQWRHNGVNYGSPSQSPVLNLTDIDSSLAGVWDVVFTLGTTTLTSSPVTLTVNDAFVIKQQTFDHAIFKSVAEGAQYDGAESGDTFFNRTNNAPVTHSPTHALDLGFTHDGRVSTSSGGFAGVISGALHLVHYSSTYSGSDLYNADPTFFGNRQTADLVFDPVDLTGYKDKKFTMDISELGVLDGNDDIYIRLRIDGTDVTIFDTRAGSTGTLDASDAKNGAVFDGTTLSYTLQDADASAQLLIDLVADDPTDGYALDNIRFKGIPKTEVIASQDFDGDIFKSVAEGASVDGAESDDLFFQGGKNPATSVTHVSTGSNDLGFTHDGVVYTSLGGTAGVVNGKFHIIHYTWGYSRSDLFIADNTFFPHFKNGDFICEPVNVAGYMNKTFSMDLAALGTHTKEDREDIYIRLRIDGVDVNIFDTRQGADGIPNANDARNGATYNGTLLSYSIPDSATSVQLLIDLAVDGDGDGYSFDNIQFTGEPEQLNQAPLVLSPFEQWKMAHWVSGELSTNTGVDENYDGDAYENLQEFAFGLDPKINDTLSASHRPRIIANTGGAFKLAYRRIKNTGLHFIYESSSDLENWTPLVKDAPNGYSETITPDGDYEQVEIQLLSDQSSVIRHFLRIRIQE